MRYITTFTLMCLVAHAVAVGQEKLDGAGHAKRLAPFIDDQTVAVAYVDLGRIDTKALQTLIGRLTKTDENDPTKQGPVNWFGALKVAGGKEVYFILGLQDFARGPSVVVPIAKNANADAVLKFLNASTNSNGPSIGLEVCDRIGDAVFAGSKAARERLKQPRKAEHTDLTKAFDAAGDAGVKVAVVASADTRKAFDDTLQALPDWLGGGSPKVLTRGAKWAAGGFDISTKLSVRVQVQSSDEAAAQQIGDWWKRVVSFIRAQKETAQVWPNFDQLAPKLSPNVEGNRVTLALDDATLTSFLQPAVIRVKGAADRARVMNGLKQTGLALHCYHDVASHFPRAANYSKDGKPLLSWRVHVLPYLDQDQLYKQFKLDEPWDSEHNKKLIAKMPAVYRTSENLEPGKTTLLGVAGDRAMFPSDKAVKISEVRDGTSNTIIVVDADESRAVTWTKPEDYKYDPAKPGAGLTGRFDGRFAALLCDGSVRIISGKIEPKLLNLLFDRDDGQVIGEIP